MKSPIDLFFSLGNKVTRGDPRRQQDFTYYMLWILFLAFFWLFLHNAYQLFFLKNLNAVTWTLVGFAVMGLQFFSLKGLYDMRQLRKNPKPPEPIESVEEMMKSFNKEKGGEDDGIRKEKESRRTKEAS